MNSNSSGFSERYWTVIYCEIDDIHDTKTKTFEYIVYCSLRKISLAIYMSGTNIETRQVVIYLYLILWNIPIVCFKRTAQNTAHSF